MAVHLELLHEYTFTSEEANSAAFAVAEAAIAETAVVLAATAAIAVWDDTTVLRAELLAMIAAIAV